MNHKHVERLWRLEALKVPQRQPKWARLWLVDVACIWKQPEYPYQVRSFDFILGLTHDDRGLTLLVLLDVYSRESLVIDVRRHRPPRVCEGF